MEVEIFESTKKNLQIKKYSDTSARDLKPGGGEGTAIYGFYGYVPLGMVFKQFTLG